MVEDGIQLVHSCKPAPTGCAGRTAGWPRLISNPWADADCHSRSSDLGTGSNLQCAPRPDSIEQALRKVRKSLQALLLSTAC